MSTPDEPFQDVPQDETPSFDFNALMAEPVEMPVTHEMPNVNVDKVPWWKSIFGVKKSTPKPIPPMPRGNALRVSLENFYNGVGLAVSAVDPHCGGIIIENAAACAKSMDELAKTNPALRRVIMKLVATSAMGTVIAVHAPIVMAISVHHIPALRERQEKMVSDMGVMFAKMAAENGNAPEDGA